jgi:hypothetical protein
MIKMPDVKGQFGLYYPKGQYSEHGIWLNESKKLIEYDPYIVTVIFLIYFNIKIIFYLEYIRIKR